MDYYFSGNRFYPSRGSIGYLPRDSLYDRKKVIVIGPLEATQEVRKTISLSPTWGGPLFAVGIVLADYRCQETIGDSYRLASYLPARDHRHEKSRS
jgi:hypothetical protein